MAGAAFPLTLSEKARPLQAAPFIRNTGGSVNNLDLQAHLSGVLMRKGFLTRLQTCGAAQSPQESLTITGGRPCHHEIVTPLKARNAVNAAAIAASIAPAATMRAIVALKSAARALSTTLRIASKPCAATAASERLNLI